MVNGAIRLRGYLAPGALCVLLGASMGSWGFVGETPAAMDVRY